MSLCLFTVLFVACTDGAVSDGSSGAPNINKRPTKPARTEFSVIIDNGRTVTTATGKVGKEVEATAAELDNKIFLGWQYEGETVSADLTYRFQIERDASLIALYCNAHTIYLDPGDGAVEASEIKVGEGQEYRLPVPELTHFEFLGWFDGSTAYADNTGKGNGRYNYYEDIYLTARWQRVPEYAIKINNGTVDDRGNDFTRSEALTYYRGESVTLTAVKVANKKFIGWVNSKDETVSDQEVYSFTAVSDEEFTAQYKSAYTVIALNGYGGGEFEYLEEVTVRAQTNNYGYKFSYWRNFYTGKEYKDEVILDENGEEIGKIKINDDCSITFNVSENITLEAIYEKENYKVEFFIGDRLLSASAYYIDAVEEPEKKAALIAYYSRFDITAQYNDVIDIPVYSVQDDPYYSADEAKYLVFEGWADAPEKMPPKDVKITGKVVKAKYNINATYGLGGGTFEVGTVIKLTPKDLTGKRFICWTTADGAPITEGVDENNVLTVTVTEDATYIAKFEDIE